MSIIKESLIKSSAYIAPSDFQADCTKNPQECLSDAPRVQGETAARLVGGTYALC